MKEDILTKARILSKEWQIQKCEKIIKDNTKSVDEISSVIGWRVADLSEKGTEAHHQLQSLLKEIDNQEVLRLSLNQELLKLNNADGYCYCESCVANRARVGDEK